MTKTWDLLALICRSATYELHATVSEGDLFHLVHELASDASVNRGLRIRLVQLPKAEARRKHTSQFHPSEALDLFSPANPR